jgi:hypothetical protein
MAAKNLSRAFAAEVKLQTRRGRYALKIAVVPPTRGLIV